MPRKTETVTCPRCEGEGVVALTGVYAETLAGVRGWCRKHGGYIVANQAADAFGCEPTALCNRLDRLESLGLLTSETFGRERRFSPV